MGILIDANDSQLTLRTEAAGWVARLCWGCRSGLLAIARALTVSKCSVCHLCTAIHPSARTLTYWHRNIPQSYPLPWLPRAQPLSNGSSAGGKAEHTAEICAVMCPALPEWC